ncbi:PTS transporter subunit EIIC [Erysipelothrix sp. D19-032]
MFTGPFRDFFSNFGGGGSTLSLVIVMMFFAKSQRLKQLGRLSIVPGIFGINEMIIFGLPVVLNPIIIIPFLFVPVINSILSTIMMTTGLIPLTTGIALPWTTPFFFSGWLSTGSIFAGIFQIGLVVLDCFLYYPFFKILDKQYLHEESLKGSENDTIDELDGISLDDISFDDL